MFRVSNEPNDWEISRKRPKVAEDSWQLQAMTSLEELTCELVLENDVDWLSKLICEDQETEALTLFEKDLDEVYPRKRRCSTSSFNVVVDSQDEGPEFIYQEVKKTAGTGKFSRIELCIMLHFAAVHFSNFDQAPYSGIKHDMKTKRSRLSIRRKIEKLVLNQCKISGSFLESQETMGKCLKIMEQHYNSLIVDLENSNDAEEVSFARRMINFVSGRP